MLQARKQMINDFVLVDAAWPTKRALGLLNAVATGWVVVRRREPPHLYHYLDTREHVLKLLAAARSEHLVRDVLGLHEYGAAPVVTPAGVGPGRAVVVNNGRVVGIVVPETKGPAAPAVGKAPTLGPPRSATRRGMAPPAAARPPPPPPSARSARRGPAANGGGGGAAVPATLERDLGAKYPRQVAKDSVAELTVELAVKLTAAPGAPVALVALPAGAVLDILALPGPGLALAGSGQGTLTVTEPQQSATLHFPIRAVALGGASVRIMALHRSALLATLVLDTEVIAAGQAAAPGADKGEAKLEVGRRIPPDLSLTVWERDSHLQFLIESLDGSLGKSQFEIDLKMKPQDYFRQFFQDIEQLPVDTAEQRKTAEWKLRQKGNQLFALLFPTALQDILWRVQKRIATVLVTSDEPWVPWELCRLQGKDAGGAMLEGGFFCEAFAMSRWLFDESMKPDIPFGDIALVVPGDSGLPDAGAEAQAVKERAGAGRTVTPVPATLAEVASAMAAGRHQVWHFTGHAAAEDPAADADRATIHLEGGETLTPGEVVGEVGNVGQPHPFVFLNGCQSGRGGVTLSRVGGWAQCFVGSGASAFIGSHWSIGDEAACKFAQAVYTGLLDQKRPIAQVVKEARAAIRPLAETTWLAYTLYADPGARASW